MAGRRGSTRTTIAERRRMVFLDLHRGLSPAQVRQKRGVSKKTLDRDLVAIRKRMAPEDVKKLRALISANVRAVFKSKNAEAFVSLCQEIIRGKTRLPVEVMPRYSKMHPAEAQEIIQLLLTTDKNLRQISRERRTSRRTVTRAYNALVVRGDRVAPRGRRPGSPIGNLKGLNKVDPALLIKALENLASKAGLTLQEKAVAYCGFVGMQQREMAEIVGVSKSLINKLAKSSKKKMIETEVPKA